MTVVDQNVVMPSWPTMVNRALWLTAHFNGQLRPQLEARLAAHLCAYHQRCNENQPQVQRLMREWSRHTFDYLMQINAITESPGRRVSLSSLGEALLAKRCLLPPARQTDELKMARMQKHLAVTNIQPVAAGLDGEAWLAISQLTGRPMLVVALDHPDAATVAVAELQLAWEAANTFEASQALVIAGVPLSEAGRRYAQFIGMTVIDQVPLVTES